MAKKIAKKKKEETAQSVVVLANEPYDISKHGVTNSILSTWVDCRVRAKLMLEGWSASQPKAAFQFGSLMHLLLENLYRHGPFKDVAAELVNPMMDEWRKSARSKGQEAEAVENDLAIARILTAGYAKFWAKKDAKKRWEQLEGVFDIEYHGFRLRGRRDGIYQQGKSYWLLETKTASTIDDDAMGMKLNFDPQILFYILTAREETGLDLRGALYNIIRKPGLKRGKNESQSSFWSRIAFDVDKRPEWYFVRYEVPFTGRAIQEYEVQLLDKLNAFKRWCTGESGTYRNEGACTKRWKCGYLPICASGDTAGFERSKVLFNELAE